MTTAIVTTIKGEVLHEGSPSQVVSTLKAEVLHHGVAKPVLTTIKAEVLHGLTNLIVLAHRRVTVVVTSV